ncbi:hypothetical protein [Spongiimicrobium salis]|uniref:hypothetical protein n=1 Tax=Spongiimicrobium salis TaxID=1667022 RepID=UPI00374D41BF
MIGISQQLTLILFFFCTSVYADKPLDYNVYHKAVIEAEELIASENYKDALRIYDRLLGEYDFVFLREYQVATQLAFYLGDKEKAITYLQEGIRSGWTMKSIKNNNFLKPLRKEEDWKLVRKKYRNLRKQHTFTWNSEIRKQVKKMYSKDQRKALKALFKFGSKAKERYAERRFAPHSEKQIQEFSNILDAYGFPSERLIGNRYWMSTILSHHNSISTPYTKKDSSYPKLKPKLMVCLQNGQISPYEFAVIDDWYLSVKYNRKEPTYGILDRPTPAKLSKTNALREKINMRPYELRDALILIEKKIGVDLYLSDRWY